MGDKKQKKVVMHIRNARPEDLKTILLVFPEDGIYKKEELIDLAESLGYILIDKQHLDAFTTARDLRLIEIDKKDKKFKLTRKGQFLRKILLYKPAIFVDVVHGLQILLWPESKNNPKTAWSWAYKQLVDILWEIGGSVKISSKKELASHIISLANETFGTFDVSFSPKSVLGGLKWLEQLNPPVINEDKFKRRTFCPPELFILAVDYIYKSRGTEHGTKVMLTEKLKEEICKICLLEPTSFEKVLEYAKLQFNKIFSSDIGGGWGQYLLLEREPTLIDLLGVYYE